MANNANTQNNPRWIVKRHGRLSVASVRIMRIL
jgi:hypothetical protein